MYQLNNGFILSLMTTKWQCAQETSKKIIGKLRTRINSVTHNFTKYHQDTITLRANDHFDLSCPTYVEVYVQE